ncbi:MAG: YdgA family protein [Gammaproteobacteria bacterium]
MKKRYFISGVVLLAIAGGTSYLYGTIVENKFKEAVALFNKSDNATLNVTEYKRGWLNSQAKTDVIVHSPKGSRPEIHMTFEHKIQHGPIFKQVSKTGSTWQFAQGLIESKLTSMDKGLVAQTDLQNTGVIDFTTLIGLNGESEISIKGDQFRIKDDGQGTIDWQGLTGHFNMNSNLDKVKGEVILPGIVLKNKDVDFSLEDVVIKTEQSLGAQPFQDLWLGNATVTIQHLVGKNEKHKPLNLDVKKILLGGVAEAQDNHLRLSGTLNVDQFNFNEKQNGPLSYSLNFNKVSPDALRFLEALNLKAKENPAMGGLIFIEQMGELARLFLTPRPELAMPSFQLTTSNGVVNGQLQIAVGGEAASNLQAPQAILDSIEGNANLSLPKPILKDILVGYLTPRAPIITPDQPAASTLPEPTDLAQKADQAIQELVQSGMLIEEKEQYKMNLLFKGVNVTVNGKPFVMPSSLQMQSMHAFRPAVKMNAVTSEPTLTAPSQPAAAMSDQSGITSEPSAQEMPQTIEPEEMD